MNTPSSPRSATALHSSGPSATFLQQLLNEINGVKTPPVARKGVSMQKGTPPWSARSCTSSRRASSVWVGGTAIATDARDKLRAADEARLGKGAGQGTDGTPVGCSVSPRLLTPVSSDGSLSSLGRTTRKSSHSCKLPSGSETRLPERTVIGDVLVPASHATSRPLWSIANIATTTSPLMFCDADSDISSTPSPSEAPTSALTAGSTEASTACDMSSPPRHTTRSVSPNKTSTRSHTEPEMLSKRMCTMTLPETRSTYTASGVSMSMPPAPRTVASDNRRLIRHSTCIERAPLVPASINPDEPDTFPALSSFRPDVTGPHGLPPATPTRVTARRPSVLEGSPSPDQAETPIYARSLHLVDTDISVYKAAHGEAWRANSLCLYCFRNHGMFNRILTHGYEVCGSEEMLDSHFWEPAVNPYT